MPDDLTAVLADMKERAGFEAACTPAPLGSRSCDDAVLLLAAAERVLALHQPGVFTVAGHLCEQHAVYRHFSIDRTEAEQCRACPDCTATLCVSCTCGLPDRDRCPTVAAITEEVLTKEEHRG